MKKTIVSILLGIALSAPVAYAACRDKFFEGTLACTFLKSTIIDGHEVCVYICVERAPQPQQPPKKD